MQSAQPNRDDQGDLLFVLRFAKPQFPIVWRMRQPDVDEAVFGALVPFGARLDQMRRQGAETVADASLEFTLLNFRLSVRLFADRLECQIFGVTAADNVTLFAAATSSIAALLSVLPSAIPATARWDLRLHTQRSGRPPTEYVGQFAGKAPELGTLLAQGASFYFGPSPQLDIGASGLILEPSSLVAGGVFFNLWISWNSISAMPKLGKTTEDYTALCSDRLGVRLLAS